MIIQPFIENAIWHGVSATRKDILVQVYFKKTGPYLSCTVEDNGVGIKQSKTLKKHGSNDRTSHGIANVQDRLKLLSEKYNLPCSVTIIDKKEENTIQGTGTIVTILLPFQTIEE
jgi:sensor histidine kinase YesM